MYIIQYLLTYFWRLGIVKYNVWITRHRWSIRVFESGKKGVLLKPTVGFWADPFFVAKNGNKHIFFENYKPSVNRGVISHVCLDEQNNESIVTDVITEDHHLSFPFLIEYKNELYMIPESKEAGCISLYKCIEFPLLWKPIQTLIENIDAVDTTIFFHNNIYWLFCTVKAGKLSSSSDALFIYHSKGIDTNWAPHANNPVKLDSSSARSAGKIFESNGKLFRPVQNNLNKYGKQIDVYEIHTLTNTDFKDSFSYTIDIKEYNRRASGMHTFNKIENTIVIDTLE